GNPVWPINSEAERSFVAGLARLFGGTTREAPASPGVHPASSSELVVGVGTAADEAPLYAHLTHRRWAEVKDVAELASGELPAVVLFCGEALDRELIQFLSLVAIGDQAPGVVWGRSPDELHTRVLGASCAARINGAGPANPHLALVGPSAGL